MSWLSFLANHLWQSTIFAGMMWALTALLKKNAAAVRYGLWMAASMKFLVPFALLVSLGGHLGWRSVPRIAQVPAAQMVKEIGQSFDLQTEVAVPRVHREPLVPPAFSLWQWVAGHAPEMLLTLWLAGFLVGVGVWLRWLAQMRELRRMGVPVEVNAPLRAFISQTKMEPCVFGVFRPILLLPEGIREQMPEKQFDAVVAHEWNHIQRRDNLTAALHMLAETALWFWPVLRWIRVRMIEERERACDEAVLRQGNEPEVYAESILRVCKFYLAAQPVAAGVSGFNLKRRIEVIVDYRETMRLGLVKKVLLGAVAVVALGVPVLLGQMNAPPQEVDWEKAAGGKMSFEVASIKENKDDVGPNNPVYKNFPWGSASLYVNNGGRLSAKNARLVEAIGLAYMLTGQDAYTLIQPQLPDWAQTTRYDFEAHALEGTEPTKDQMRLMMQSLLAERFKLKMHTETKEVSVYALRMVEPGKLGPQIKVHPADVPCSALRTDSPANAEQGVGPRPALADDGLPVACGFIRGIPDNPEISRSAARGTRIEEIRKTATVWIGDGRPVIDQTGLDGTYDFTLQFTPDTGDPPKRAVSRELMGRLLCRR